MKEFIEGMRRYADFTGTSTRREFWMFVLVYFIADVIISLIDSTVLLTIFWIVTIVPSVAITVRRLRDAGFSPWWAFIGLIPLIGLIVLIVMCAQKSVATVATETPEQTAS